MISELFFVDWALASISLFNALLLIWLGLIVFLNAERRDWGVWLVGAGFLSGALFFVCHTVIVGHELTIYGNQDLEGWWQLGWYPVVFAPLSWYLVVLWYAGFWDGQFKHLRRLHRPMLVALTGYTLVLMGLLTFARPLPTYINLSYLDFSGTTSLLGTPVLLLLYPPFGVVCVGLSLDVLRHPAPSQRMMGDLARRRARPWLMAATVGLLLVVTLVAGFIFWLAMFAQSYTRVGLDPNLSAVRIVVFFDLMVETLIGLTIILLGQAIVSYEIFTGQVLPRRGFFRQWRGTILFAWVTAWTVGFALNWWWLPIFSFMLATVVMMVLYAFFGWRMFKHREEVITRLRPFIISQHKRGLPGIAQLDQQAQVLFTAICQDVLDTTRAYLIPLGTRAPLVGPPLTYPPTLPAPTLRITPDLFPAPDPIIVGLDADQYAGAAWGIPLWTERGLIGALLLGLKGNNAVYAREEIEIARASAERILDTLAGEQIAQRLVQIQRRRFAETRVLDLRTRRMLHDDILPELHMIALQLSALAPREPAVKDAIQSLTQVHHQISDLIHTSSGNFFANGQQGQLVRALRELLDAEFAGAFDAVTWQVADDVALELDPLLYEVVYNAVREVVRNAALHGRGDQPDRALHLAITIRRAGDEVLIAVQDDGVGMALGAQPVAAHDSTDAAGGSSAASGSGGGLLLHSTMLAISGGEMSVTAPVSGGTQVVIALPI